VRVLLQPADQVTSSAGSPGGTARAGTPTLTRVRAHPSYLVALGVGSAVLVLGSVQPELLLGLLG
jgi:hypothetical protein